MILNQQLSKNFTLYELIRSATADRLHINNEPASDVITNLKTLCQQVLQPARDEYGKPMFITSGYRCKQLNKAVGGVYNSYHLFGQAADIMVTGQEDGEKLAIILNKQPLTDLVLVERHKHSFWVHVQFSLIARHKLITHYSV